MAETLKRSSEGADPARNAEGANHSSLRELLELDQLIEQLGDRARVRTLLTPVFHGFEFPIQALSLGTPEPNVPVLLCVAGVHGLERIGCQVVLAFLEMLTCAGRWDRSLLKMLESVRLVFLPVVNPVGIHIHRRSNGNGVDLMRNAPVNAVQRESRLKIYRGHRLSRHLPWYRGSREAMELEAQALCDWVQEETRGSQRVMAVDVHSGFFGADRLWFPYARTHTLFPHIAEALALKRLLDETYPRNRYVVEPQATQYTTHGDLWDYIYDTYCQAHPQGAFLPFTLELGASSWLKKSWRVFDKAAFFHPQAPHRTERVLRRHVSLFEFLARALYSWEGWAPREEETRALLYSEARTLWE